MTAPPRNNTVAYWARFAKPRVPTAVSSQCIVCGFVGKNLRGLGLHVYRSHHITSRTYYERYFDFRCLRCGKKRNLNLKEGYGIRKLLTRRFCSVQCYADSAWVGRHVTVHGYINVNIRDLTERDLELALPMANQMGGRAVLEHRLVMARELNRPLRPGEQVHHRDGDRANNAIANLELRAGPHGSGATAKALICPHCGKSYA